MENNQKISVDVIKVIWSRKQELFLFSLIVTGSAFLICFILPKQYEVKASVLIIPAISASKFETVSLSVDSYKELAMMSSVLKEVVEDLRGKGFDSQNQLYPETLRRMVKLETTGSKKKKPGELVDPFIILLKVKGNDPTFITETANTLAHFWVEEGKKVQENLSKVNQARRLIGFKREYGGDMKKTIKFDLYNTRSKLAEHRNGIGFLQKQIKDTPQEEEVPGEFPTLAVKLEYLMKSELLRIRIRKEKLNGKEKFLKGSLEKFSAEISVLEKKIKDKNKEKLIKDVKLDKNALKEGLDAVSTPLRKPEQFEGMKILSKAIEPSIPLWPDKFKISLIAFVASLFVGLTVALGKEHVDNLRIKN